MTMVLRFFVVACAFVAPAFAQGNLGGFTGTVVDTSNASVPEAKLTFTSNQTNSVHSVVADAEGVYTIRGLTPGTYHLEVEKQGFKKYLQENVTVLTATISSLNVELSLRGRKRIGYRHQWSCHAANYVSGGRYSAGAQGDSGSPDSGGRFWGNDGGQWTPAA